MSAVKATERPQDARKHVTRLSVWVPALPPTVNHYRMPNGRGGVYLSPEVNAFRLLVLSEVRAMDAAVAPDCRLGLTMRLTYPTRARTDIDNRIKSAVDALALALNFDDARIDRLLVERAGYDKGRPACEMVLEVLE